MVSVACSVVCSDSVACQAAELVACLAHYWVAYLNLVIAFGVPCWIECSGFVPAAESSLVAACWVLRWVENSDFVPAARFVLMA